jgi:hypothetical protein
MTAVLLFALVIGLCAAQLKYEQWEALMNVFDAINCTSCPRFSEHDPCPATTAPPGRITGPTLSCQGTVVKGMYAIVVRAVDSDHYFVQNCECATVGFNSNCDWNSDESRIFWLFWKYQWNTPD